MSTISRFAHTAGATLLVLSLSIAKVQDNDLFRTLSMDNTTSKFLKYANDADMGNTLESQGPFTLLVPNNAAFAKFKRQNPALYKRVISDRGLLKEVLRYDILRSMSMAGDFKNGDKLLTLEGNRISVTKNSKGVRFNGGARIVSSDLKASNGIIQVIDTVLIPKSVRAEAAQ